MMARELMRNMIDNRETNHSQGFRFIPVVHLTDGQFIPSGHPDYVLAATPEQQECEHVCHVEPHYGCTRRKAHKGDHAAHGANDGDRPVMFARWRRE